MPSCPYCKSDIAFEISPHALERLEARAYLKYFRNFRLGETKPKWLMRKCLEAIEFGYLLKSEDEDALKYWFKGLSFVLKKTGKHLTLVTFYPQNRPKKKEILDNDQTLR